MYRENKTQPICVEDIVKNFYFFNSILMLCILVLASSVQAQTRKHGSFESLDNGQIMVDGQAFESMEAYFNSDYFRKAGKRCGTLPPAASLQFKDQADCTQAETIIQNEYWPTAVLTIPVVVHIITKTDGTGNISDERIQNQIKVLNEDYAALTGSLGENGFNTKIQFKLVDTTRTQNDSWFNDEDDSVYKAALGRDQNNYCNIYVNSASGFLGYAYFPQTNAGTVLDGLVINYEAFGGRDEGSFPYNQGRTTVHEMGHYLAMYHTFQGGSTCDNSYTGGDLIVDTPAESEAHYSCTQTNTCGSADPIHNYMNYTPDLCMNRFTSEQANRMVCALVNYRADLADVTTAKGTLPGILHLLQD